MEIVELNRVLDEELKGIELETSLIHKVELMIEETFKLIMDNNPNKKIYANCTVMVDEHQVQLITWDNGKIFDITKEESDIGSLGWYVTSRLMSTNKENLYLTSISFNRNCFRWEI